jgi:RNA polymerase primary sigma factor
MVTDLSQSYIAQKRFLVLPPEEITSLFQELEQNRSNHEVRDRIVEANLPLVSYWARKIRSVQPVGDLDFEDLFQEGTLGLMRAVERFDWRRGFRFSTYATWWIRQAIFRAIENSGHTIRVPVHVHTDVVIFLKAQQVLIAELGREPSAEETAGKMRVSPRRAQEIQRIIALGSTASLDKPFSDDDKAESLLDILPSSDDDSKERFFLRETIDRAIKKSNVTPRERKVLELRFGLDGKGTRTLEEIGQQFKLTRERIRQIEKKALMKLRFNRGVRKILKGAMP